MPPQATSEGGGAAPQLQLERAMEERKLAQENVREMAERYTALQEKFRCVFRYSTSYAPSRNGGGERAGGGEGKGSRAVFLYEWLLL